MNTLASRSDRKLENLGGTVVTKGFLDGSMSFMETVKYLESLGISGSVEGILTKSIVVPPGAAATYIPSSRTYATGDVIRVREHTWEEFKSAVEMSESRSADWEIQEGLETNVEEQQKSPVSAEGMDYQSYDPKALDAEYDRIKTEIENSNSDEQSKKEALDYLDETFVDLHERMETAQLKFREKVIQDDEWDFDVDALFNELGISLDTKNKLQDLISELDTKIKLRLNTTKGTIEITQVSTPKEVSPVPAKPTPTKESPITKQPMAHTPGVLHLGALLSALEIGGRTEAIEKIASEVKKGVIKASIDIASVFTSKDLNSNEMSLYKDMLDKLSHGRSDEDLFIAAVAIGTKLREQHLSPNKLPTVEEVEKVLGEVKKNVDHVLSQGEVTAELRQALENYEFQKNARELRRSLDSGYLVVSSLFGASNALLGSLDPRIVDLIDENYTFGPVDKRTGKPVETVEQMLDRNDGDEDKTLKEIKTLASKGMFGIIKSNRNLTSVDTALNTIFSASGKYSESFGYKYVLSNKDLYEKGITPASHISSYGASFGANNPQTRSAFISALSLEIEIAITKANRTNTSTIVKAAAESFAERQKADGKKADLSSEDAQKALAELSELVAVGLTKAHRAYQTKSPLPIDGTQKTLPQIGEQNSSSVPSEVRQGLLAIFNAAQFRTFGNSSTSIDRDASQRAAAAITLCLSGDEAVFDPSSGYFVGKTDTSVAVHARILGMARFFPPLTSDGYKWSDRRLKEIDSSLGRASQNDIERIQHLANSRGVDSHPISLVTDNFRAGLNRVVKGITSVGSTDKDQQSPLFSQEQASMWAYASDYDTSSSRNKDRISAIHRRVGDFIGKKAMDAKRVNAFCTPIPAGSESDFFKEHEGVSIASIVGSMGDDSKIKPKDRADRQTYRENAAKLIIHRLTSNSPPHFQNGPLLDEINKDIDGLLNKTSGSKAGTDFEVISELAVLMEIAKEGTNVRRIRGRSDPATGGKYQYVPEAFDGYMWEDLSGNKHIFGGANGVTGGALDSMHIKITGYDKGATDDDWDWSVADGAEVHIDGYEFKMEKSGVKIPHIGSMDSSTRVISHFLKSKASDGNGVPKAKRVVFGDVPLVNTPWETTESVERGDENGCYSVMLDPHANGLYVSSGLAPSVGKVSRGTYNSVVGD